MIYATVTVPVNPTGKEPLLLEQIWRGLELKARDARTFLPSGVCEACHVVAEGDGFLVREAIIAKEPLTEIVSFEPMTKVYFHQAKSHLEGVIVNELIQDQAGELQLRFYCLLGLKNAPPGGPEEQREQEKLTSTYTKALATTLERTRALVKEGLI